jgi:hypothetical protein
LLAALAFIAFVGFFAFIAFYDYIQSIMKNVPMDFSLKTMSVAHKKKLQKHRNFFMNKPGKVIVQADYAKLFTSQHVKRYRQ